MSGGSNRIWQPVVDITDNVVPHPSSLNQYQQQHQSRQVYTKTSLVSSNEQDNRESNLRSLNRDILTASQAYNNSPKPFSKQASCHPVAQQSSIATSSRYIAGPTNKLETQQVKYSQKLVSEADEVSQEQRNCNQQEENMAPKLVHNQYNSPIDLYSMNNIRKTIEAHTELIAPGVKGINFKKPDTPVNKQSEVYKLVMEEEQRARSQQGTSRLSPISGQPLNIPTALIASDATQSSGSPRHLSPIDHYRGDNQQQESSSKQQEGLSGAKCAPTCCECGQFIVGPFARIQNRFVHPQCFNCTTCGTSLKNIGYFTVNEKLYCNIHAKQVANMMHIHYDFERSKQELQQKHHQEQQQENRSIQSQTMKHQQSSQLQKSTISREEEQVQQSQASDSNLELSSRQHLFSSSTSSPATISTMFADRSNSETSNSDRREVKWAWRPMTSKDRLTTTISASSTGRAESSSGSSQQQELNRSHECSTSASSSFNQTSRQDQLQQQQQSMVSLGTRGRSLLQESSLQGGRVPVCTHCHVQIQGPYILAGKTTWCKVCSQTNFNCSSCRRSLLDIGFIEDNSHKYYCEHCFEAYYAPICSKCNLRIKGDCLNALNEQWHPSCFVCGHCGRPFGNSSFYLEDNVPYCERDWNVLFTTKCYLCSYPIEAGDKWIEALDRNYHSNCFRCTSCQANLEGSTFYCKGGKPYCRLHAR